MTSRTVVTGVLAMLAAAVLLLGAEQPQKRPKPHAPAKPQAKQAAPGKRPIPHAPKLQELLRVQRQFIEMMADPVLAAQLAITRIKDMAAKGKETGPAIEALEHIAESAGHPAVRRSALFAASELHARAGNTRQAVQALTRICRAEPRPPAGPAAQRRLRGAGPMRPGPAAGRAFPRPMMRGPMGRGWAGQPPRPLRPGQPRPAAPLRPRRDLERREREEIERRERREREEMRPRERPEREEMERRRRLERETVPWFRRPYSRPPAEALPGRRLQEFVEQLEDRCRELDERAALVERRLDELKRLAAELPRREGELQRRPEPERERGEPREP